MSDQEPRTYDYLYDDEDDSYVYPGTKVLVNRFKLTDSDELSLVERQITGVAVAKLEEEPINGNFDLRHLQLIHEALFGEIYPWAGIIRQKGFISKGHTLFCGAEYIKPYSNELFRELHEENLLVGMQRDEFIGRMAFYISEVNALHPFREGNGRTQRVFANQLAKQAGWNLNLRTIDPDVLCNAYITAMTDLDMLVSLLRESVEPVGDNKGTDPTDILWRWGRCSRLRDF